jgi:hypothetical protein
VGEVEGRPWDCGEVGAFRDVLLGEVTFPSDSGFCDSEFCSDEGA